MLPVTPQSHLADAGFRGQGIYEFVISLLPTSRILYPDFFQLARKDLNLRPASYKDAALTAELRASSWVGGIRTHTSLIKSQVCSRYTTTQ